MKMLPLLYVEMLCILFVAVATVSGQLPSPVHISAVSTEKAIELTWDSVPGAVGYNVYTASEPGRSLDQKTQVNAYPVTSGTRFTFIWTLKNGQRERAVKGFRHYLSVAALDSVDGAERVGFPSAEVDNNVFAGCERALDKESIFRCFVEEQRVPRLPCLISPCTRRDFIRFMSGPGRRLFDTMQVLIDPREVGGCTPVSTVLVKLLKKYGIQACRADGTFIEEFHSFVIINIEGVEYVLDFTADQFVPGVAPVLVPRNHCFINPLNGRFGAEGRAVYTVARLFLADNIRIADSEDAAVYRRLLNSVMRAD